MNNLQLKLDPKRIRESFKESLFWSAVSYSKVYELLHMQLWRKGRIEFSGRITLDGKEYGILRRYNIKSGSTNPYNRYSRDDLGLNQFFVGQNPRKRYQGDPSSSSGIYHDDCYITPKNISYLNSLMLGSRPSKGDTNNLLKDIPAYRAMSGWKWRLPSEEGASSSYYYVDEYDSWGKKLVSTVVMKIREDSSRYALISYMDNTTEEIEIKPYILEIYPNITYENVLQSVNIGTDDTAVVWVKGYVPIAEYIALFGEASWFERSELLAYFGEVKGRVYIFKNGLAFFLAPPSLTIIEGGEDTLTQYITTPSVRQFNILVNLRNGRTLMSKSSFVDYWSDIFELYVREESEWWEVVVQFVILIVAVVIAYFSVGGGTYGVIAAFGAFIGTVGAMAHIEWLQALGIVISLGASIASSWAQVSSAAAEQAAIEEMSVEAAKAAVNEALIYYAFTEMAPNLLSTFFTIYNLYRQKEMEMGGGEDEKSEEQKKVKALWGYEDIAVDETILKPLKKLDEIEELLKLPDMVLRL